MMPCGNEHQCCCKSKYEYDVKAGACTQPGDESMIPGSDKWASCYHANMHTCGDVCCCYLETKYDTSTEGCVVEYLNTAGATEHSLQGNSSMVTNAEERRSNDTSDTFTLQVSLEVSPPIAGSEGWTMPCEMNDNMMPCGNEHQCCC